MNNKEVKKIIKEHLLNLNTYVKEVNDVEVRTRCPFCGDSIKDCNTGHLYIRISEFDNYPILYNCFKCNSKGILKYNDLELFEIYDDNLKAGITKLNKTSGTITPDDKFGSRYFDFILPDKLSSFKISYIEKRLGIDITDDMAKDMKIITSLKDFMILNNITKYPFNDNIMKLLENRYIGFLSYNNSHILFRDITDREKKLRWIKYPITEYSKENILFYAISANIDIFTKDEITINLSEGVFDIISIAYNCNQNKENTLNISVTGKVYTTVLNFLIHKGFIGKNITINIYADRDYTKTTGMKYYRQELEPYKIIFKEMNVFYNVLEKDCGVPKDRIMLQKEKI